MGNIIARIGETIDPLVFLLSLTIGVLAMNYVEPMTKVVIRHPTPANFSDLYKDSAGNCWTYDMIQVSCSGDTESIPIAGNSELV